MCLDHSNYRKKNKTVQYTSPASSVTRYWKLDHYSKRRKKSNYSRDEIYEKNNRIHLDGQQNKHRDCNRINTTPVLDKILGYRKNWIRRVNRMPRHRLPRIIKYYTPKGRRNQGRPLKRLLDV